ncbi:MAG: group II intron maturase-specific domain-containing protein, partial [Xenococcaceae cyanobacterium]
TVKAVFNTIRDRPQFLLQVKIRDCQSQTNFWFTKILVDRLLERAIEEFNLQLPEKLKIVKYHEQILVFNSDLTAIEQFKIVLQQCLPKLNLPSHFLEMSIIHTLDLHNNERSGFDFLGFNFRQYVPSKHHACKNNLQKPLNFKTIVTPNKEEIKKHDRELGQLIDRLKTAPANILIAQLNSLLSKWTNYYSLLVEKNFFHQRDRLLFVKLWHWACYRHPRKSARFIWKKYWQKTIDNGWVFTATSSNSISV